MSLYCLLGVEVSTGKRDASPKEGLAQGHSAQGCKPRLSLSEAAGGPGLACPSREPFVFLPRPGLLPCLHSCASYPYPLPAPAPLRTHLGCGSETAQSLSQSWSQSWSWH